jgi:hypothetical protein
LPWALGALAGEPVGAPPSLQGPRIMLYVSQSLSGGGTTRLFGLRLDRSSIPPVSPGSYLSGPVRQRELVNLQFSSPRDMHIDFGRRVTWDFNRGELAASNLARSNPINFPAHAPLLSGRAATN